MIEKEIVNQICNDYNNGMIQKQLENKYKISRPTIRKILKENNIYNQKYSIDYKSIIENYNNNISIEEICIKHNISMTTLYNILKKNNINKRLNIIKDMDDNIKKNILNDYVKNNLSINSISNKYNICNQTIKDILNNYTKIYDKRDLYNNKNLDNKYFNKIDTKEKAYWLGFIITDGCMSQNKLSIGLKLEDIYILELLAKDLNVINKVKIINNYGRFTLGSKQIAKDLLQYGIKDNKTFDILFPENIKDEFMSHFLRGCFDGDGGLSVLSRKNTNQVNYELNFTGTYSMVEGFKIALLKELSIKDKKIEKNHSVFKVRWGSKQDIITILEYLYKDSNNHKLIRKYNKYLELL